MNCPACDRELQGKTVGDINVDVCDGGCGGIWFDVLELKKLDEKHETAGKELLGLTKAPDVQIDHEGKRECPKCKGPADQGFSREDPPSPYYCIKCEKEDDKALTEEVWRLKKTPR